MNQSTKKLGTFEGVFTPTILTILGVIMYLRLGWVVGNAGFGGALVIILLAKVVTISTGLSIASIATNTRVGAGGSYALISRSLGLEIGSAIGIPLYLSQALGGALYIVGFVEGWLTLFPTHPPLVVATSVLLFLLVLSITGAKFAMKANFFIMAVIIASLFSFFLGQVDSDTTARIWGEFESTSFWIVFAIFFPAVTGIEAGAAMSGDLTNTRKSLPLGILTAIGISLLVYVGVAFWLDHSVSKEALLANYTIMADNARWKSLVIAGILGATLSSALGSVLGAPRTLMALGQDKVLPFHRWLSKKSKKGEPIMATIVTVLFIQISLIFGDLNTIAPLLTMFFLITYGTINIAVAIEKGIGIPSFRPAFNVPLIIPIIGGLWSISIMFLIDPTFASGAIILIILFYIVQVKRGLKTPWGDVRVGMFHAISEWAAKSAAQMPKHAKTWKPNMMILVENPKNWVNLIEFIKDLIFPSGTLRVFSIKVLDTGVLSKLDRYRKRLFLKSSDSETTKEPELTADELEDHIEELIIPLKESGLFSVGTVIESNDFLEGISIITQVMRGMYFPPNIYFLTMSSDPSKDERLERLITIGIRESLGICIFSLHPKNSLGVKGTINVWLRRTSPNKDLAILMALQLQRNWNGIIRFVTVEDTEENAVKSRILFEKLSEKARFPANTEIIIMLDDFDTALQNAPKADINLFGLANNPDCSTMHTLSNLIGTSCLFLKDSGEESMMV